MENYDAIIQTLALTLGVAWASGINLYAVLLVLGIGGLSGEVQLPSELSVLQDPLVIGAAGIMYMIEFIADKTPGVDTGWDSLHTFIRIPAGAMLAVASAGDVGIAFEVAAGILGGSLAGATHLTKASSRLAINTSPEPFSNWFASVSEDVLVFAGLWTALNHPIVFLVALTIFIGLIIWLLPKLLRFMIKIFNRIRMLFTNDNIQRVSTTGTQSLDYKPDPKPLNEPE